MSSSGWVRGSQCVRIKPDEDIGLHLSGVIYQPYDRFTRSG